MKYNGKILLELSNTQLKQNIEHPIIILKTELVSQSNKEFLKVYLLYTQDIAADVKKITFNVFYTESINEYSCQDFKKSTSYDSEFVYGCVIPLQGKICDSNYLSIKSYFIGENEFTVDNNINVEIEFNSDQREEKKNDYLRLNISNYAIFPNFTEKYWQCSCGSFNLNSATECINCANGKSKVYEIYLKGLVPYFNEVYEIKSPLVINPDLTVSENAEKYIQLHKSYFSDSDYVTIPIADEKQNEAVQKFKNIQSGNRKLGFIFLIAGAIFTPLGLNVMNSTDLYGDPDAFNQFLGGVMLLCGAILILVGFLSVMSSFKKIQSK